MNQKNLTIRSSLSVKNTGWILPIRRAALLTLVARFSMRKSQQKRIILNWIGLLTTIVLLSIFDEWISENWGTLKYPLLIIIVVIAVFSNRRRENSNEWREINRIVEENPWIKIYLVVYGSILTYGVYYIVSNNIKVQGAFEMLLAIYLLVFPVYVIKSKERFIDAGK